MLHRGLGLGSRGTLIDLEAPAVGNGMAPPELDILLCMAAVLHTISRVPSCGVVDHIVNRIDRNLDDGDNGGVSTGVRHSGQSAQVATPSPCGVLDRSFRSFRRSLGSVPFLL